VYRLTSSSARRRSTKPDLAADGVKHAQQVVIRPANVAVKELNHVNLPGRRSAPGFLTAQVNPKLGTSLSTFAEAFVRLDPGPLWEEVCTMSSRN